DVDQTAPIHAALAAKGLLPGDHLVDAGFVDVELLVGSQFEHGVRLVGPMRPDVSWQAQAGEGVDIAHFAIDWEAERVTCPEGKTSALWKPGRDRWGHLSVWSLELRQRAYERALGNGTGLYASPLRAASASARSC